MATQRAILVTEIAKPAVQVENHPVPEPGKGQIQVKVAVTALNPHDQKGRDLGLFIKDSLPAVLAFDVVGTVTKLGEGTTGFSVGDRVVSHTGFAPAWNQSGLQEYAIEDAAYSSKIPEGTSNDDAATIPTNVIAGVVALFKGLKITAPWTDGWRAETYKNSSILVVGGGSNCGIFGVQLAKLAGFGTIITVGGSVDSLKALGATEVIDRHLGEDNIVERIRAIAGDELLYAYDAINPPAGQSLAVKALSNKKRGALARLLAGSLDAKKIDVASFKQTEAGVDVANVLGASFLHGELCAPFWAALPGYLKSGAIRPTPYATVKGLTAENANAILDAYRDGKKILQTHIHV